MSDRSLHAERERYIDHIRRSVACVSRDVVIALPLDSTGLWQARFANDPTRLPTAPNLTFRAIHDFQVQLPLQPGSPLVRPAGYHYELRDQNDEEVFAYHLHTVGLSHITTPHLHVPGGTQRVSLEKRHLVTGLISFPEIIRCLITEFDVTPLRPDWRDILRTGTDTIVTTIQD